MVLLVTGGAGYIGSHFVAIAQERGEQSVILDDLSTGRSELVPSGVPLLVGDVGEPGFVASAIRRFNVRTIMHFAGKASVSESMTDPLYYYDENVSKTRSLIEIAVQMGVREFIFSSSAAVYGTCPGGVAGEDTRTTPLSPYGRSKLMAEWMLADAAAAHKFRFVALRYFNVAGADPDGKRGQVAPRSTHLIRCATQAALGRLPALTIHGVDYPTADGTCVRDYIHVSDLAHAHLSALDYLRKGGANTVFNCGYGQGISVRDVVESVRRVSGIDFPVIEGLRRSGDPAQLVARTTLIKNLLGWQPQYMNLDTIVAHALTWERTLGS